jgi:hypothetical protein
MKVKIIYALLLLLCCTLGASSNRNTNGPCCEALKNCTGSAALSLDKGQSEAEPEESTAGVTSYLPGYSIIFMN